MLTLKLFHATYKLYLHHTNEILLKEPLTERSSKQFFPDFIQYSHPITLVNINTSQKLFKHSQVIYIKTNYHINSPPPSPPPVSPFHFAPCTLAVKFIFFWRGNKLIIEPSINYRAVLAPPIIFHIFLRPSLPHWNKVNGKQKFQKYPKGVLSLILWFLTWEESRFPTGLESWVFRSQTCRSSI